MVHSWALQCSEHRGDVAAGTSGKAMAQSQLLCCLSPQLGNLYMA